VSGTPYSGHSLGPWPEAFKAPVQLAEQWRDVRNEYWPANPRSVPERPHLPVWAWIEWTQGEPEWLPGIAVRWNKRYVQVAIGDPRLQIGLVWLVPHDVQRRTG
jgi:hypothetical protein